MRIATYNIHGGVGGDGRFDIARTVAVIEALDADVIALQEVESAHAHLDVLAYVSSVTGLHAEAGPTLVRGAGPFGNALLARSPLSDLQRVDLSVPGYEPRGALGATVIAGDSRVRVFTTHLGLRPAERRRQVRTLLGTLDEHDSVPIVLLGDINEWLLWGRPLRWLHAVFRATPAPPTFPARLPVFALDRLWVRPWRALKALSVYDTALSRAASDHLPLVAVLEW